MKSHFEVLDLLRGTAALSHLLFQILEITIPDVAHHPLRHAHDVPSRKCLARKLKPGSTERAWLVVYPA